MGHSEYSQGCSLQRAADGVLGVLTVGHSEYSQGCSLQRAADERARRRRRSRADRQAHVSTHGGTRTGQGYCEYSQRSPSIRAQTGKRTRAAGRAHVSASVRVCTAYTHSRPVGWKHTQNNTQTHPPCAPRFRHAAVRSCRQPPRLSAEAAPAHLRWGTRSTHGGVLCVPTRGGCTHRCALDCRRSGQGLEDHTNVRAMPKWESRQGMPRRVPTEAHVEERMLAKLSEVERPFRSKWECLSGSAQVGVHGFPRSALLACLVGPGTAQHRTAGRGIHGTDVEERMLLRLSAVERPFRPV
jgi:hypothetical protein